MNPIHLPGDMSREEIVSVALRQCALILDPRYGRLSILAAKLELHDNTLTTWMRNGRIPPKRCRQLHKLFGGRYINIKLLVGA